MKTIIKQLYHMLTGRQKLNFVVITAVMLVSAGVSQVVPLCIGELTDSVLAKNADFSFYSVLPFLLFILFISVFNEILKVARRLIVEDTCTGFEKSARSKAIETLLKAPLSYFKENMTGNIHGKLNRSLEGTTKLLKLLFMDFAPAIFNGVAAVVVIFYKLPFFLALGTLMVVPIGVLIVYRQISTQKGIRLSLLEEKSNMDGVIVELLGGIEVIRVYNTADMETRRFTEKSEGLRKKEMKHHVAMAKYDAIKFINEAVFTVIIIGGAVFLAGKGRISVGMVLTSYLCFTQLTAPLRELHRILDELSESVLLANEYFKIKKLPLDFSYEVREEREENCGGEIGIEDLTFSYEKKGEQILDGVTVRIPFGTYLGIAGTSGCGKSTLIKLLCKLEKTEAISIGGRPISRISREGIAKAVTLIPQIPFLIAGSIRDNITYGIKEEISEAALKEAARRASIDQFIESLPQKYDSPVAEGGKNLSGGQKQRIALARIFLRKPKILILDEATSALDNVSEKNIQEELEKLHKETGMTILAIAHRLTTLENCDSILVMEKGRVVQKGTYEELIGEEGVFRNLYLGKDSVLR